jgi:hypothetical protein
VRKSPKVRGGRSEVDGAPIANGQRSSTRRQQWASHRRRGSTRPAGTPRRGTAKAVPCPPETPSYGALFGQPAVMIEGDWFQTAKDATRPRPSGNTIEPGCGSGLSLVLTECSSPPGGRDARGRRVATHRGRTRGRDIRTGTPLVRASALHGVSPTEILGRGSHLGSTLKPGRAVLTGGVFRRSRSVACIRADASPSEVLALAIMGAQIRCCQAYLRLVCAFTPVRVAPASYDGVQVRRPVGWRGSASQVW